MVTPTAAHRKEKVYGTVAKTAFVLYFFFILFGTSLPFKPPELVVDDIGTRNPFSQVAFSVLFLAACVAWLPKARAVTALVAREKVFFLFLAWCAATIFWSGFWVVSFKRFFLVLTGVTAAIGFFTYSKSAEEYLKYCAYVVYAYVVLTLLSVFLIPAAIDPMADGWRGLETSKNYLGQTSAMCVLICFYGARRYEGKARLLAFAMLLLSIITLVGSKSTTSLVTCALVAATGAVVHADHRFRSLGIGHSFVALATAGIALFLLMAFSLVPDFMGVVTEVLGKDPTFTGRTDLWAAVMEHVKTHPLAGCGIHGFWVLDNPDLLMLYEDFVWLPNQAHMGYLDLLNETGAIGLALFIFLLIRYFGKRTVDGRAHYSKWLVVAAVFINTQESTFFWNSSISGVVFVFAYLSLFSQPPATERESVADAVRGQPVGTDRGAQRLVSGARLA